MVFNLCSIFYCGLREEHVFFWFVAEGAIDLSALFLHKTAYQKSAMLGEKHPRQWGIGNKVGGRG